MEDFNDSLKEAVCIEEEVFFGPIADKERKIREQFENAIANKSRIVDSHLTVENDVSKNDSLYKSFSVEESKYDSFEDSLNEDKQPQETKHVSLKKSLDKLKSKRHGFYDSLEDVCSLVSNMEKCSISCEVENNSNFNNKQHIIEDSLKNQPVAITNKSNEQGGEQLHFDDDSLAILEYENTFDDSLEEINDVCVLSSIDIEDMEDIENMVAENQNVAIKVEQNPACFPRNLFDSSVQIVYEKKWSSDQEESSDDKNVLYDSISNSEFKDILKDSLEEPEKCNENLNFLKVSSSTDANIKKSERMVTQNSFDSSVQIVFEDLHVACRIENTSEKTNSEYNELSKDSLENSKNADVDLMGQINIEILNESDSYLSNEIAVLSNENAVEAKEHTTMSFRDAIDSASCSASNQNCSIVKDAFVIAEPAVSASAHLDNSENVLYLVSNADKNEKIMKNAADIDSTDNVICVDSKANFNCKIMKDTSVNTSIIGEPMIPAPSITDIHEVLCTDSKSNQNCKVMKDTSVNTSIIAELGFSASAASCSNSNQNYKIMKDTSTNTSITTEPVIPASNIDIASNKEEFSVDSCHLEPLNDDLNIDKDMEFQLHLELTVGDKKCQLAPQEMKVTPPEDSHTRNCEKEAVNIPVNDIVTQEVDVLDNCNSKLNTNIKEFSAVKENIVCYEFEDSLCKGKSIEDFSENSKLINVSNVTRRTKSSKSHFISDSEEKNNFPGSLNDVSLLQALDLHDISASFLNESVIQSNNSLIPLNLCCKDLNICTPIFRDESKENVPQPLTKKKSSFTSSKKASPNKVCTSRTPKHFQNSPTLKDSVKKSGTKIPVRKIENFAVPTVTPCKTGKQHPTVLSAEKANKCQSPHSASKKTAGTTPNKTAHYCKVRNTIFSKVPQIVPSKKYMNIQSPVAQYIKNIHGSGKIPRFDPVLRDCMNQPLESPYHSHHTPKSGTLKSTKKKI